MNPIPNTRSSKKFTGYAVAGAFLVLLLLPSVCSPSADLRVAVKYPEGILHAFLIVRTPDGKTLADGELTQYFTKNGRISSDTTFHFKDGSFLQETTVFSQHRYFRLISDHVIQKGAMFEHQMDLLIDGAAQQVTMRYSDRGSDKAEQSLSQHISMPSNLANGLFLTLIKNMPADVHQQTLALLAATPKPRMVKVQITREDEDVFSVGEATRKATRYRMKIDIGGIAGVVADVTRKQPPDSQIWILGGDAPVLMKWEGPLFAGGPVWRIDLVSPVGPKELSKQPAS